MTSVRYLHTMRFLKEILAFVSHFPQLIDAFQRMKANAEGKLVSFGCVHYVIVCLLLLLNLCYNRTMLQGEKPEYHWM